MTATMYLFDTDHLSIVQRKSGTAYVTLNRRVDRESRSEFRLSIISFHEQVLGWNSYITKARDMPTLSRGYQMFEQLIADFSVAEVLPFDQKSAEEFQQLRNQHIRIGTMDLRIAAIALAHDATLLSRNLKDFQKVPRLRVEDWTT